MRSIHKIGLFVLALIAFIVIIFADFFTESSRKLEATIPIHSYFPNYFQSKLNISKLIANKFEKQQKSFREKFRAFPWDAFEEVVAQNLTTESLSYFELFIVELTYFLMLEPLVPINEHCKPPTLTTSAETNCYLYRNAFTGIKRSEPAKIGVLLQFGFDVDVLEIHLNELFGVVDQFFIIESTHAHYGKLKKPLMWERVKQQKRFRKFPVIHFIIDDAQSTKATDEQWSMESLQERLRWDKFLEWNAVTKYFSDDDIIGFGDADEIPNRTKLNMFKYCETAGDSIDFGIWFPFGHIKQAFRSDFPVASHPLTLGDPTYFKLAAAKDYSAAHANEYPSRRRGGSGNYMLGGIHMTHYGYLPFQIVKHITATEYGLRSLTDLQRISKYLKTGDIANLEIELAATPANFNNRLTDVNTSNPEMKEICVLPWFYRCNRKRYPVWEDGHDTRLN